MSDGEPRFTAPPAQTDAPVHCAACGKYNERVAVTCHACGAHLWVKCAKCGTKAARTASRCGKCHHRLRHRRLSLALPRWNRRFRNRRQRRLVGGFLVLVLLAIAVWLTVQSVPEPVQPPSNTAAPD